MTANYQHEEQEMWGVEGTLREHDAARYIGMSPGFLRQARMHSRGPAYLRIGRAVRYRIADLDDWLVGMLVTTRDQAA